VNWLSYGPYCLWYGGTYIATPDALVGLAVTSHNNAGVDTATFDNVTVTTGASPAPAITSVLAVSGTVGQPFSFHIMTTGTPTSFTAAPLPAGLRINDNGDYPLIKNGLIIGTPTAAPGVYPVTITATNASGTDTQTLTITINPAGAPTITSALAASGTVNAPITSYQITASNSPNTFAVTSALPAGLTFNGTDTISGTPTANGTTYVALTATNANGTAMATLTFTIRPATPVITSATANGTVGTAFNYTITASNSPASFGATPLPAGLSLNATTGAISGTPTTAGTTYISISATNGSGTGWATLVMTVAASGSSPVINSVLTATAIVGTPFSYTISATHTPLSYGTSALPSGLTLTGATISGTPDPGTNTYPGDMSILISATNADGTGTALLNLMINTTANVPVITSPTTASGTVGVPFTYHILGSDTPPGGPIGPTTYTAAPLPAGLTLTGNTISGTPTTNGVTVVTLNAINNDGTGTATLTIYIGIPVITSSPAIIGAVGQVYTAVAPLYTITATNSPTSFAVTGALPAGLTVDTTTGAITGTPTALAEGITTVTISATNGNGTGTATLAITIPVPPPSAPVIDSAATATGTVSQTYTAGAPLYAITAISSLPILSYDATPLPAGLAIDTATGKITGTPTASGTPPTITISATNAIGTGTALLDLTINPSASTPVINSALTATGTVGVPFTYTITTANGPFSIFNATPLPAGLGINTATGEIFGTPTAATALAGTAVTISATNGVPETGTAILTLTVSKAPVTITLGGLATTFNWLQHPVTATTNPAGVAVSITYDGSTTPPTSVGSYTVVATVTDTADYNDGGGATGTLVIAQAPEPAKPKRCGLGTGFVVFGLFGFGLLCLVGKRRR
jgi:hypothetical protein